MCQRCTKCATLPRIWDKPGHPNSMNPGPFGHSSPNLGQFQSMWLCSQGTPERKAYRHPPKDHFLNKYVAERNLGEGGERNWGEQKRRWGELTKTNLRNIFPIPAWNVDRIKCGIKKNNLLMHSFMLPPQEFWFHLWDFPNENAG